MTDRLTNGKTINQQTNTASDLMCFLLKVSGVSKNIPVSFFEQVKHLYRTVERFLGHPIYPENFTE